MIDIRVRAVIIEKNNILLIKRVKKDMTYWIFPGGGLEPNETNEEAVVRECKEELGVDVSVEKYFDNVWTKYLGREQENLFYICEIISGEVGTGSGPEYQEGDYYEGEHIPEWITIDELKKISVKPDGIKEKILNF